MTDTALPRLCPPPLSEARQNGALRRSRKTFPAAFPDLESARAFLLQVILPPSGRWGFLSVGKNASSSTLHLLFRAEFGCAMTTEVAPLTDINPDAAIHMLAENGVFTRALWQGLSAGELTTPNGPAERICVVRDPFARAVSGFRYLCESHRRQSPWFARDRFRMNAVVRFDWSTEPDTARGFHKFLDYIAWQTDTEGPDAVDAHWRPQAVFVKPAVFRPTLVGRMEDMARYWQSLSERLGVALPGDAALWRNRQPQAPDSLTEDTVARRRVRALYSGDYEAFGY